MVLLAFPNSTFAQEDSWKNTPVTLRKSNESLGTMLKLIAQQAGATIEFKDVALVGIDKPTTVNIKNKPLDKALADLIGNQAVRMEYQGGPTRHIIITSQHEVNAQNIDNNDKCYIEGVVQDAENAELLVGATIVITDGTKNNEHTSGSVTDINGKFALHVPRKASIRISYLGYETQSIQILKSSSNMKINLKPDGAINMNDVVVTGISKRSKSSFTGNFVEVSGDDLRKLNPNNFLKGLQYFDPSFKIMENNLLGSDPNAQPEFRMRGDQSLGGVGNMNSMDLMLDNVSSRPNTPLFVLDGFIVSMSRILQLDPQRIANVTILKDASATAIYGSRAANGVIVI